MRRYRILRSGFERCRNARHLAVQGALAALDADTRRWLERNSPAGSRRADLASVREPDGTRGIRLGLRHNVRSLVRYGPEAIDEAGDAIPETTDVLTALTGRIVKDTGTPTCIGWDSGTATRWPATDRAEDMMLCT